jgi:hypothetical protein
MYMKINNRLNIFSDKRYLRENDKHVFLLYPFWGLLPEPQGDKDEGRFDQYCLSGKDIFNMVSSIAEADIVILPFEWRSKDQWKSQYDVYLNNIRRIAEEAGAANKRLVIFFNNDSRELIPVENTIVFRTSFSRSARRANEFALPGWSVDFLPRYLNDTLPVRKKSAQPTVGYCGYVDYEHTINHYRIISGMKRIIGKGPSQEERIAAGIRGSAVRALRRDKRLTINFVRRKGFSGCCEHNLRQEYVKNIVESDYALVARGAGNFSYRLYEVLSCGRIPVFIDTDCVLPFDNIIDWKKHAVWVDIKDIDNIGQIVIKFHETITESEFEELQHAIRKVYEEWISPTGFFSNLWRCL